MDSAQPSVDLTNDDFTAFIVCLAQVTNVNVRYTVDSPEGPLTRHLTRDEFIAAMATKDAVLATKLAAWWDASASLREHVVQAAGEGDSLPFELNTGGHVL